MLMLMPPYHGTGLRADENGIVEHFAAIAKASDLPIMVQDAPLSGVTLSVSFLVRLAREVPLVQYFKIETAQAAAKLHGLIAAGGASILGPFDGEESITLAAPSGELLDAVALPVLGDRYAWGRLPDGSLLLVDEVLTPDSSRFWPAAGISPGRVPDSFDKQFVRDWLEASGWDKSSPPPALPEEVVLRTREKYLEACRLLTGETPEFVS
jgi:hypothetical protein